MRILNFIPSLSAGGAERQLALLAPAISALGADVAVAYGREGPNLRLLEGTAADIIRLPVRGNHNPVMVQDLRQVIRYWRADIVQTWILQMDVFGGLAACWTRTPHILSERCSAELYSAGWKNRIRQRIGQRAAAIVANSEVGRTYWKQQRGSSPVHLVRNGVSPPVCSTPADDFGLAERRLLLAVGRLSAQKNPFVLVEGLAAALQVLTEHHALVLGDGELGDEVRGHAASLPEGARIRFAGVQQEVGWWMERADAFVSASRYEGHPNVVIEAASAGCPMVLSDIAAHREVLDGRHCLWVPLDDAMGYAQALVEAVGQREASLARAQAARLAVADLTIESAAKQYLQIYDDVLRRAAR